MCFDGRAAGQGDISGVRIRPFEDAGGVVWIAEPEGSARDLTSFWKAHDSEIEAVFRRAKGILFRGFEVPDIEAFGHFVSEVSTPMQYIYRSTPRTALGEHIYTATEYPASRSIPLHCENAYQDVWPTRLMFYCDEPADVGGETPLADVSEVTRSLRPEIKEEFAAKRVKYVRNYREGLDLSWQTVFGTDQRADVEAYCRRHGIRSTWLGNGELKTEQVCDAMVRHPETGELLWFNQAHLFHVTSLDEATQAALSSIYSEDELPRHAWFGDGSAIDPQMLEHIRGTYHRCARSFPWRRTDVLLIDNLAVAHGRNPFRGKRRVLVAMGNRRSLRDRV